MSKIVLTAVAVLAALLAIVAFAWLRADDRTALTISTTSSSLFEDINPEREFVSEMVRPKLSTPLFKTAIVDAAAGEAPSLKAQADIVIILMVAREISPSPLYDDSLKAAANNLLKHYRDPQSGKWQSRQIGSATNRDAATDTVAKAILALIGAYKAAGDERYLKAAISGWQQIEDSVMLAPRLAESGETDLLPLDGQGYDGHALAMTMEAMLALHNATDDASLWQDIETLARFTIKDLMAGGSGYLAREYTAAFAPVANGEGNVLPADQFIIAFILGRATDSGLSPLFMGPGGDLIDRTLAAALAEDGTIHASLNGVKGEVVNGAPSPGAGVAAARALAHYAYLRSRSGLWQPFARVYPAARKLMLSSDDPDDLALAALMYREIARLHTIRD